MMEFTVNQQPKKDPINLTLTMEKYCGVTLPTLKANGVSLLHILPEGEIVIRSPHDTNIKALADMGFKLSKGALTVTLSDCLK